MTVITTSPILEYLRNRLRAGLVERELVSDPDLLKLLSEAYTDVCERSRCLVTFTTITFDGSESYAMPSGWYETEAVFSDGERIREVALRDLVGGGTGAPRYCAHVGSAIRFSPQPTSGAAIVMYAETPPAFSSWAATLDPRFPPEYAYLLVHHVRWKVLTLEGGAQRIPSAIFEHSIYDTGIAQLRRSARRVDQVGPSRIRLDDRVAVRDA